MKRKAMWVFIVLVLFDIGFVSTARATRRNADSRRQALLASQPAPLRATQYYPLMNVRVLTAVQLPDQLLMPGEYTFQLINGGKNVSIAGTTGALIGTYVVVPAYRRNSSGGLVNTQDAPDGGPDRIVAWFFPDQQDGYSFLYPTL